MRRASPFGTINFMTLKHRRPPWLDIILAAMVLSLAVSCASNSDPISAAVIEATPSPTPFQPQPGVLDVPYSAPVISQPEPTFTPYPLAPLITDELPTPIQIMPTPGGLPDYFYIALTNPLTGLPASDPALLNRRPMAVKIANAPDYVRPQSGLSLADVVYEYYIEWGDTRFIAVMYGNDSEKVGPVRSGRYFDEHITRMYHSFFVFKYADPREYTYFKASDLLDFLVVPGNGSCPPFSIGQQSRDTYNNIFFNTVKFGACTARMGVDNSFQHIRSGFFSDASVNGALTVSRIYTHFSVYSYNYWEYDAATRKYFRYQESKDMINGKPEAYAPLTDAETGLPVTADNVVMLFVPHTFANHFDQEDEVYHIDLVDSGDAYVFRDGTSFPARWYRTDMDQPILLATLSGNPIFLRPGRTFYEVLGETSTYEQNGSDWRFTFSTP
ncbi:MAG: DUF3048 domain-containing protein [Chloroflexi bacterium]|nr:DUF3048 domain-containing protein [Chloroflexota bacterium]